MKSLHSEEMNQKKLTKRTILAPRTSVPKSRNEVYEKEEKSIAKDTLSRTNSIRKTSVASRTSAVPSKLPATKIVDKTALRSIRSTEKLETKQRITKNLDMKVRSTDKLDTKLRSTEKLDTKLRSTEKLDTKLRSTEKLDTKLRSTEKLDTKLRSTEKLDTKLRSTEKLDTKLKSTEKLDTKILRNGMKHSPVVAKKTSDISINKRATPSKIAEPILGKRIVNNSSNKGKKELPIITNVTVNSPVHVKKIYKKKDEEEGADANARERSKTRTLQDGEAKILTIDNNVEMSKLMDKVSDTQKALPKSFYIDLSDGSEKKTENRRQTEVKNKVQISISTNNDSTAHRQAVVHDGTEETEDADSYEDDFESYESDFESYKSETSSKAQSDSSESLEKLIYDEKMLDSGSFELHDGSYKAVTAGVGVMEEIEEGIGAAGVYEEIEEGTDTKPQQQQSSLTDEGFIEMASSASPVKKVPDRRSSNFFDLLKSRETSRRTREAEARQRRAADLTSMITLDQVTFSLHEMRPLAYDSFMSLYGRGASYAQATTQTHVDNETRATQTENVSCNTKWTQCPLAFSNEDIWVTSTDEDRTNKDRNGLMEETIESIMGINAEKDSEINDEDGSAWMKMDSVKGIYSKHLDFSNQTSDISWSNWENVDPLIVYVEQKNGCGASERMRKNEYERMLKKSCDYDVGRLNRFLNKVSKRLFVAIGRTEMDDDGWKANERKEWQFSDGYKVAIEEEKESSAWKVRRLVVSETDDRVIVSVHELDGQEVDGRGRLCVWRVGDDGGWVVRNILSCTEGVRECGVVGGGDAGSRLMVVAGLEDGSVCAWDVGTRGEASEPVMTSSVQGPAEWCGRIVGLVSDTLPADGGAPYLQWHVLYEYGTLCTCRLTTREPRLSITASHRLRAPTAAHHGSRKQEESSASCGWESGLICYALRRALHNSALLVACNGGHVTEFTTNGVLRVYTIREPWCTLVDIAPYHSHSADGVDAGGWYVACGSAGRSRCVTLARGSRALRTLAAHPAAGGAANEESRVWWSRSGATVVLSSGGVVSVWELTRGDLEGAGSTLEARAPVRSVTGIGTALGVVYESGRVELHRLMQNPVESRLLHAYLQLL